LAWRTISRDQTAAIEAGPSRAKRRAGNVCLEKPTAELRERRSGKTRKQSSAGITPVDFWKEKEVMLMKSAARTAESNDAKARGSIDRCGQKDEGKYDVGGEK
jgi:hypothetical protein